MSRKHRIIALTTVYLTAVAGVCTYLAYRYDRSFEPVVIYSHPMQETVPDTTAAPTAATTAPTEAPSAAPTEPTESLTESTEIPPETAVSFPLDLNTATKEELCAIPEVGEVLADAVIAYRTQIGSFLNREQLRDIPGIGEKRLAQMMPYLCIENEQPLPTEPPATQPPVEIPLETEPPTIPVIDLNTTSREELLLLPGCTEEIADAILKLRDDLEGFRNPLELTICEEVTDALFLSWRDYLIVAEPATNFIAPESLPAE